MLFGIDLGVLLLVVTAAWGIGVATGYLGNKNEKGLRGDLQRAVTDLKVRLAQLEIDMSRHSGETTGADTARWESESSLLEAEKLQRKGAYKEALEKAQSGLNQCELAQRLLKVQLDAAATSELPPYPKEGSIDSTAHLSESDQPRPEPPLREL